MRARDLIKSAWSLLIWADPYIHEQSDPKAFCPPPASPPPFCFHLEQSLSGCLSGCELVPCTTSWYSIKRRGGKAQLYPSLCCSEALCSLILGFIKEKQFKSLRQRKSLSYLPKGNLNHYLPVSRVNLPSHTQLDLDAKFSEWSHFSKG